MDAKRLAALKHASKYRALSEAEACECLDSILAGEAAPDKRVSSLAASLAEVMTECPLDVALRRMESRIERALADEREACAKVADEVVETCEFVIRSDGEVYNNRIRMDCARSIADAVRARGAK